MKFILGLIASLAGYMLALWKYEKYLEMIRIVYLIVVGVFGVGAIISRTHNFAGRILRNFAT